MPISENWKKSFLKIYIGQAFSLLTSSAVQFSIIWWITVQTESALALTLASVVGLLPQAVIGLFAGVWIDRFNRKAIMIISDSTVALSSLVLFWAFSVGYNSMLLVYIILFIRALGETFHKPSLQAVIPQIVPSAELTKVGGVGQFVNSACTMLGPLLGALLMSIASLQHVMLIDVLGALIAVLFLSKVKITKQTDHSDHHSTFAADLKAGISEFKSNKALLRLAVPMLISTVVFVPLGTLLPLIVKVFFNGSAWHNGLIQTMFSSGMLISAMIIGITGGFKKQFFMISLFTGLLGVSSLIAGLIPSTLFWLFCIIVFVMGTTGMGFNIPFTAYIQRSVPAKNIGKVISLVTSIMSFAAPAGMFIAGPVSEMIGINKWMIVSGVVMIFIGILSYFLTKEFDSKTLFTEDSQLEESI